MTRENKLALVVGFGLILLVGILISDHFSAARSQETADLRQGRPVDPLTLSRRNDQNLIDLRPEADRPSGDAAPPQPDRTLMNNTHRTLEDLTIPVEEPEPYRIVIGGGMENRSGSGEAADPRRSSNANAGIIFHNVQRGESLSAIADRYYGDRSLAADLARFNGLTDPNSVRINHRLRIPPLAHFRPAATGAPTPSGNNAATPPVPSPQARAQTYTIQQGDSLSEISQRLLGTSRRWREIFELNQDVIRDPDNVPAGIVIKIPR